MPDILVRGLGRETVERLKRRAKASGRSLQQEVNRAPLEIHPNEPLTAAALDIAVRHNISAYDGLYLALAAGHGCQLVTADRRLYEICRATEMAPLLVWVGELPGPHR